MRVASAFPIEHPLETMKTYWQAHPYIKNEAKLVSHLVSKKGVSGLYAGAIANLSR